MSSTGDGTHRGLLRHRPIRWLYYRGIGTRNLVFALGRWTRNHVVWLSRVVWYRTLSLLNLGSFAVRWTGLRMLWLGRFIRGAGIAVSQQLRSRARIAQELGPRSWATVGSVAPAQVAHSPMAAVHSATPTLDAAIVIHAYHLDVLAEILDRVKGLAAISDVEVFVTCSPERRLGVEQQLDATGLSAEIVEVDNLGRDIRPFLELIRNGRLAHARLVLKLHTKRSPHRADGDAWRTALVDALTDVQVFPRLVDAARRGEQFVTTPSRYLLGSREWGSNVTTTARLAHGLGIVRLPLRLRFPGGSMFWMTADLVARMGELTLTVDDYEAEPLPLDGAIPHAVERLIGVLAAHDGRGVVPLEQFRRRSPNE